MLRGALEDDWGLEGFVISDADAVGYVYDIPDSGGPPGHFFRPSLLDAAVSSLINGTTISLEDEDPESAAFARELPVALAQGLVTIDQIKVVCFPLRRLLPLSFFPPLSCS